MRVEEFYKFIIERETIRLKRAAGEPWPWTEDKILRTYKFTNVKREFDKTSQHLRKHFFEPNRTAPRRQVLLNAAIARYFGRSEFAIALGWQEDFQPDHLIAMVKRQQAMGQPVWTGAYMITNNGIAAPKEEVVVKHFLGGLWKNIDKLIECAEENFRWFDLIWSMQQIGGFGGTGFMAKETVLDTMYTDFWPYECGTLRVPLDWQSWCPLGPGARRGVARLMGESKDKKYKDSELLDIMKQLFNWRARCWPSDFLPLDFHDIQFQLCEFDKYERVRLEEGRPRSLYKHR